MELGNVCLGGSSTTGSGSGSFWGAGAGVEDLVEVGGVSVCLRLAACSDLAAARGGSLRFFSVMVSRNRHVTRRDLDVRGVLYALGIGRQSRGLKRQKCMWMWYQRRENDVFLGYQWRSEKMGL